MSAKRLAVAGAALAAALLFTGCASNNSTSDSAQDAVAETEAHTHEVTLEGGWAKSAESDGMTAIFGTLHNDSDHDLVLERVETEVAGMVELHETTSDGKMREMEGDLVIPANGSYELAPGANHIMLMSLTQPLLAGDDVEFTVYLEGGENHTFTVPVKDYSGANESYESTEGDMTADAHDAADAAGTEHGGH